MLQLAIPDASHGLTALAGAAAYAIALKITDWIIHRGKDQLDDGTRMRSELRAELDRLRKQVDTLSKDVEGWRDKYFTLQQEHAATILKCQDLNAQFTALEKTSAERGMAVVNLRQELKIVRRLIRELRNLPEEEDPEINTEPDVKLP